MFRPLLCYLFLTALFSLEAIGRPNVLIIYTDDQGSVDANCYGSADLITPNLDRLAETGVRFTQMLAPSAICSASRAGLMTGRYPARAGVPGNVSSNRGEAGMPASEYTLAELFRDSGYRTHHVGKWHIGYDEATRPLGQGFDTSFGHMGGCIDNYSHFFYWNGPNRHDLWRDGKEVWHDGDYFGDLMVEEVKARIRTESDQPFFLYWAINFPHYPLQGTSKWRDAYGDRLEHPRDKYAIFVSTMDEMIGEALDQLEASGKRENTLVLFQSDHGHSVEERTFGGGGSAGPYRGHKGNLFEGGIRVPSIVSWPAGLPQGETRDPWVTGCDWFPTLAALTNSEFPADHHLDGKSIVSVLKDADAPSPHERFFWLLGNGKNAQWVVREGDWKFYSNPRENVRPDGLSELSAKEKQNGFLANLKEDPGETKNLAESHPEIVARLTEWAETQQGSINTSHP